MHFVLLALSCESTDYNLENIAHNIVTENQGKTWGVSQNFLIHVFSGKNWSFFWKSQYTNVKIENPSVFRHRVASLRG